MLSCAIPSIVVLCELPHHCEACQNQASSASNVQCLSTVSLFCIQDILHRWRVQQIPIIYIYIYVRVQGRKRPELWTLNCPRTTVGPSLPVFETAWHCRVHLPEPLFAAPSHPEHLQITYQRIQSFLRLGKRLTSSILPFNSNMIPSCVDSQRWQGDA